MKKLYTFIGAALMCGQLFAGGILTNTNQSAMFTRMQARDATLGIDAVYFNPAGLALLPNNGFFLSVNNQTLGQTRTIESNYSYLNNGNYEGKVSAPAFPGVYAAYKMDKLVFSAAFNPIGGGGGGTYDQGLPSFEYAIADLVPALASKGLDVTEYSKDVYFEGSSAWFGYQGNISYQINDMISVAIGARYVMAKDTYEGYLRNVSLNIPSMGGIVPATNVFSGISQQAANGAILATQGASGLDLLIAGGAGSYTPEQALGADVISQEQHDQIIGGLTALGQDPTGMTIEQVQAAYSAAAADLTQTAAEMGATAQVLQDQEAETEATATGVTPIISINIKPNDQFNFSLKYEHTTSLEFTYKTANDFTTGFNADGTPKTMFPDGSKYNKDMPAQLVVGATYKPMEKLLISTGYHMYMDKNADWNGNEENVDANSWEYALGLEYGITESLTASVGWLMTQSGVSEAYQSDLSYSLPSNTIGGGCEYRVNEMIGINLGASYTIYAPGEKNFEHDFANTGLMMPITETYDKDVWIVAIGASFNFGGGK